MNRIMGAVFLVCVLLFATESYAGNVSKAREFMKAGMYPQAIALLEKEIYGDEKAKSKPNPTNAEAHFLLGTCLVYQGNFSRADERFASAVKLNSDFGYKIGNVYKDAGQSLVTNGTLSAANELFQRAVSYDPRQGKEIAVFLFETGKRFGNDELLSLAVSYDPELSKSIAELYHSLSKIAGSEETKVDLLGMAARYDNTYEDEYALNRESLGRYHLDKAMELARKPGKEAVTETHKMLASKYLGDNVVKKELPEAVVYQPGTYTFSLKAGEQTPYWITFPTGVISNWRLDSADGKFQAIYDDGEVVNLWSAKSLPKNKYKFRLLAVTDQPEISMVVRQR